MPRYHFHLHDDVVATDEEGVELADDDAAYEQALRGARELIADQARTGRISLGHRIEVEDGDGRPLFTLAFSDAVRVER